MQIDERTKRLSQRRAKLPAFLLASSKTDHKNATSEYHRFLHYIDSSINIGDAYEPRDRPKIYLLSSATRPKSVQLAYEKCRAKPTLDLLDEFRQDKGSCYKVLHSKKL